MIDLRRWVALLGVAVPLLACDAGTGGRYVTFGLTLTTAEPVRNHEASFVTRTGWSVTLREACIALGPLYLYESDGVLSVRALRRGTSRALGLIVKPAHAHDGHEHFAGGAVLGEWLEQRSVDLLSGEPLVLAGITGIAGRAGSYSVHLDPPRASLSSSCLRGHHAYVAGVATRGERRVPFAGGLDIEGTGALRRVEGLPLGVDLDDGAHLVLRVHLQAWLDLAHFDQLTDVAEDGTHRITETSQARQAWFLGARSSRAFTASREDVAP